MLAQHIRRPWVQLGMGRLQFLLDSKHSYTYTLGTYAITSTSNGLWSHFQLPTTPFLIAHEKWQVFHKAFPDYLNQKWSYPTLSHMTPALSYSTQHMQLLFIFIMIICIPLFPLLTTLKGTGSIIIFIPLRKRYKAHHAMY